MITAAALAASMLAADTIDDECFFAATALLDTRFERHSSQGDLRDDAEAPQLLFDWFRHAGSRVPDFRVWQFSCRVERFLDPASEHSLPVRWGWDARDRLLALDAGLRARPEWTGAFLRAADDVDEAVRRWLDCLLAEVMG